MKDKAIRLFSNMPNKYLDLCPVNTLLCALIVQLKLPLFHNFHFRLKLNYFKL